MDDASHLRALLKDRDYACPRCGYNLRGLPGNACPECGKAVDVSAILNRSNRVSYAWLTAVIAYAVALPWSVMHVWQRLIFSGRIRYADDWNPATGDYGWGILERPWAEMLRGVASTLWWLSVPFVFVVLIAFRRRIERCHWVVRWTLAIVCVAMVLLAYRRWQWWWHALGFDKTRLYGQPWWGRWLY